MSERTRMSSFQVMLLKSHLALHWRNSLSFHPMSRSPDHVVALCDRESGRG